MTEKTLTTVKDLKEYLETIPDDTKIKVAQAVQSGYSAYTVFTDAVVDDTIYYDGSTLEFGEV